MSDMTDVPWASSSDAHGSDQQPAPRRKVAWGSGASYDEESAPRPRVDAPAPAPFGEVFAPVELAGADEASETAWLHAGASSPTIPVADGPTFGSAAPAFGGPADAGTADTPADTTADTDTEAAVDLASVFDMFDDDDTGEAATFQVEIPAEGQSADAVESATDLRAVEQVAESAPSMDLDVARPFDFSGTGLEAEGDASTVPSPTDEPTGTFTGTVDMTDQPAAAPDAAVSPTQAPEPAPDSSPSPVPAQPAARSFDLAARRAALEAARRTTVAEAFSGHEHAHDARYTRAEELYATVDRILGLGRGGDPELQATVRRLVLTRDNELDREQRIAYQALLEPRLSVAGIQIANAADRDAIFDIAYDELIGIGPLGPLWRDDTVDEIMVSGPNLVTVERHGRLEVTPVRFRSQSHLEQTGRTLAGISDDDRAVSSSNPLVTIHLPRARVQFVWKPLAVSGVAIAIRKFGALMDMGQLLSFGSLSEEMATFLADAVAARATILVSGGTGSGKTTFINAVSEFIPDNERVVTIEDALELQLRNTHIERLVTKEAASADDTNLFGQDQLLKASLRLRPDRIIVGEIRDGKGCSVMLEAANTGHDGTMTTIHANGPELAVQRMAMLLRKVENLPDDVAKAEVEHAINLVVQVVRKRGRRFVSHISLVDANAAQGVGSPVTDLFVGEYPAGAEAPVFRRCAGIGPDTELAIKMTDSGLEPAVWE